MKKILVVEDNNVTRKNVVELFSFEKEWKNYKIDGAKNRLEAMNYLDSNKRGLELILLDLGIPTIQEGLDILKRIQKEFISTRILVVSCHTDRDTLSSVAPLGTHGFIAKPIDDFEELLVRSKIAIKESKYNRETRIRTKKSFTQLLVAINQLTPSERAEIALEIIKMISDESRQQIKEKINKMILFDRGQKSDIADPLDLDFDSPDIIEMCKYKYGSAYIDHPYGTSPALRYFEEGKFVSKVLDPNHPAIQKYQERRDNDPKILEQRDIKRRSELKKQISESLQSKEDAVEVLKVIFSKYPDIFREPNLF